MWNDGHSQTTDNAVINQDGARIQSSKHVNHYKNVRLFCLSSVVALITTCHTITLNPGRSWTCQGLTEVLPLDVQHGSGPGKFALNVEISLSGTERKQKNIKRYKGHTEDAWALDLAFLLSKSGSATAAGLVNALMCSAPSWLGGDSCCSMKWRLLCLKS